MEGIVVDDDDAERTGFAAASEANLPFIGRGYHHDGNAMRGDQSAKYTPNLPKAGRYEVRLSYPTDGNRATNATIAIVHADGTTRLPVNQRKKPALANGFTSVGTFRFIEGKAGSVTIGNDKADGYVVIDAVQWLPSKD